MYERAHEMRHFAEYVVHGRPATLEAIVELSPWLARGGALLVVLGAFLCAGILVRSRHCEETET